MSFLEENGQKRYIFGESKTKSMLLKENITLIEELPFNLKIPKSCDDGKPYCFDYKDDYSKKFENIASKITNKFNN